MYQLPVTKLETIRKSRKKVKMILSDMGLQYCKELLEEFKSYNPGDYYVKNTSWTDFSIWHPSKKSKAYRAKPYCCTLCDFSTKFNSAYKIHMRCYHEDEMDMETLISCPNCTYIAHPKHIKKHTKIFHIDIQRVSNIASHVNTDQGRQIQPKVYQGKMSNLVQPVYFCRICSYKDVSLYAIKKHVLLSHFGSLVNAYIGQVEDQVELSVYKYFCKGCQMKMVTYDALLYHVLDKHKEVEGPVKATIGHITELRPRPVIAPKPEISKTSLPVPLNINSVVSSCSIKLAGQMLSCVKTADSAPNIRPIGPVPSCVTTAVSAANFKPALPVISNVQSPIPAPVRQSLNVLALPQNFSSVTLGSLRPAVNAFPLQSNLIPVTVATAGPGGAQKLGQVSLVPATFQVAQNNLAIRAVGPVLPQAFLMPRGLTIDQTVRPRVPTSSQAVKHLIQNNKHINGIPAYTLTPVQFSLPVASSAIANSKSGMLSTTQAPLNMTHTHISQQPLKESSVITVGTVDQKPAPSVPTITLNLAPPSTKAQQWKSCSTCNALLPLSAYDNHVATAHKLEEPNKKPEEPSDKPAKIVACATYLQRVYAQKCKCLICRRHVYKNVLISHLLMHGLTCLFCSLSFHDLSEFSEHVKTSHAGLRFECVENVEDGISTANQVNSDNFSLTVKFPEDKMGPNDIHLTVIPSKMSSPYAPLVIEVCRQKREEDEIIKESRSSKCPICWKQIFNLKYEKHLQERHHVTSMVHPLLKKPSFKCIHCFGVYTCGMGHSTISLHLMCCRGLNTQQSNVLPNHMQSKRAFSENSKKSLSELVSNGDGKTLALPSAKRLKTDLVTTDCEVSHETLNDIANTSHSLPSPDPSTVLALVPKGLANRSSEERKQFLLDYFHKQPYPTNKEIETLSSVLWLRKKDVAFIFGMKQKLCLKAMKYKPFVLLGFNMSEMKKVKHSLTLGQI